MPTGSMRFAIRAEYVREQRRSKREAVAPQQPRRMREAPLPTDEPSASPSSVQRRRDRRVPFSKFMLGAAICRRSGSGGLGRNLRKWRPRCGKFAVFRARNGVSTLIQDVKNSARASVEAENASPPFPPAAPVSRGESASGEAALRLSAARILRRKRGDGKPLRSGGRRPGKRSRPWTIPPRRADPPHGPPIPAKIQSSEKKMPCSTSGQRR